MLIPFTSFGLVAIFSSLVQAHFISPENKLQRREELQSCSNSYSTFTDSLSGWELERGSTRENYDFSPEGLVMKITAPEKHLRMYDDSPEKLPYNKYEGKGFTFNATSYMKYGSFSASIKSANVPGAVTAVILIADNGDEIDFELLAGGTDTITSNYFWGQKIVYGVNGRTTDPPALPTCDQFYKYSIDWSPKRIVWSIDDRVIRTETFEQAQGLYPTGAARVQIGLWDGSGVSGTAQWARGPINWDERNNQDINAYVKDVKIECNPRFNKLV